MQGLMLHTGANSASLDQVRAAVTPEATDSWQPIPHATVRDLVVATVAQQGLRVVDESMGLWRDGARAFGILGLENGTNASDFRMVVGWRNSHDKSFPAAGALGSHVFVCDNLSFSGEVTFARKHTLNVMRDLPGLVSAAIARLIGLWGFEKERITTYKGVEISDARVNDVLIQSLDRRVIGPTYILDVLKEWRAPKHEEFAPRSVWSLFNAYTEVLKGVSLPQLAGRTTRLYGLLDQVAGVARITAGNLGDAVHATDTD
jgi:hypothetical protein